jgi:hypothetical protein
MKLVNILSFVIIALYLIVFTSKFLEIFLFILYGLVIYNIFLNKKILHSILPVVAFMILSLNFSNSLTMPEYYNSYCKKILPTSICEGYFSKIKRMTSNKNSIIKKGFPNTIIIED